MLLRRPAHGPSLTRSSHGGRAISHSAGRNLVWPLQNWGGKRLADSPRCARTAGVGKAIIRRGFNDHPWKPKVCVDLMAIHTRQCQGRLSLVSQKNLLSLVIMACHYRWRVTQLRV